MSYRYNTIDIILGVEMCATLFGGLLLFLFANGTHRAVPPQAIALLTASFWGGLAMAAQSREAKTLAQLRQDAGRWAFRMAA
ncbi:MAG: hypothetical protein P0120_21520 [Nitrospira sp.]|nr:hypothetical protein [Nitrospira sp.]